MTATRSGTTGFPPLAIVGMGCLFPRAGDLASYWMNIAEGVDAITDIPSTHWDIRDYFDEDPRTPDHTYGKRGGFLDPVAFDPREFGITPHALEGTDTTQLLGLLVAREALRDAGYGPEREFDRRRVSVILGVTGTLELVIPLGARLGHPHWRRALRESGVTPEVAERVVEKISKAYVPWTEDSFPGLLGNVTAGRIANRLDLHGTNCVVDAACASSLGALHLAALELAAGRADMVLTGGMDTFNDVFMYMCFSKTPAMSPRSDARPFDASADGTILGEGLGGLVLKRLADAERDHDRIYAVIRGIGSSSDGRGGAIYEPTAEGQMRALRAAYESADVRPDTVELVEAHGTGTGVGDAIEIQALTRVFAETGRKPAWCALGSVKSQIGHTKAAAGAAGVIKAALALHHKVLPPTLKVERPAEPLAPGRSPMYVNTVKRPWLPADTHPRRAAVSSFGFGGSNFHVVLEEYGSKKGAAAGDGSVQILAASGPTTAAVAEAIAAWPETADPDTIRALAARTRATFRPDDPVRLCVVVEPGHRPWPEVRARAGERLAALSAPCQATSTAGPAAIPDTLDAVFAASGPAGGSLAVLFPGQGSQYVGMMRDLACAFPEVLDSLSGANRVFETVDSRRLSDFIYPHPTFDPEAAAANEAALRDTRVAQPALGAVSLGAYRLLATRFGVTAGAAAGHSYGELTALAAAGRLSEDAFFRLSRQRGELLGRSDGGQGGMLAVRAGRDEVESVMREASLDLVVANHNAPEQVVLSGRREEIQRAAELCRSRQVPHQVLNVSAAFHSPLMHAAREPFARAVAELDADALSSSRMPVHANATASAYPDDAAGARTCLVEQLVRPVAFVDQIRAMHEAGARTFLEVGPGRVLTGLVGSILEGRDHAARALDPSRGRRSGLADLAAVLAWLAARGHPVDLTRWDESFVPPAESEADARPRFTVSLSGANYRKPEVTGTKTPPPTGVPQPAAGPAAASAPELESASTPESRVLEPRRVDDVGNPSGPGPISIPETPMAAGPVAAPESQTSASAPPPGHDEGRTTETIGTSRPPHAPGRVSGTGSETGSTMNHHASAEAVRLARETLLALQRAQEQTADLHRKFLEGQEASQRVLERLIEQQAAWLHPGGPGPASTEGLGAAPEKPELPAAPSAPPAAERPPVPEAPRSEAIRSVPSAGPVHAPIEPVPEAASPPPARPTEPPEPGPAVSPAVETPAPGSAPAAGDQGAAQETISLLLQVVSEKTGYPVEMLEPDMELDADLGIDSIKRVEIFSAMEERQPGMPSVRSEQIGELRTLRQVAELLAAGAGSATEKVSASDAGDSVSGPAASPAPVESGPERTAPSGPASAPPAPIADAGSPAASQIGDVHELLLRVVSDKTGYPVEMLELDMELDADLGIDSIKRVEIFSAMEEQLPGMPSVRSEQIGELRTLRQVAELLAAGAGESGPAGPGETTSTVDPTATRPSTPDGTPTRANEPTDDPRSGPEVDPSARPATPEPGSGPRIDPGPGDRSPAASGPTGPADSEAAPSREPRQDEPTVEQHAVTATRLDPALRRPRVRLPQGASVWVTHDHARLSQALVERLGGLGYDARLCSLDEAEAADLPDRLGALVVVQPEPLRSPRDLALKAFRLVQRAGPALRQVGREKDALLATISRLDGRFGLGSMEPDHRAPGGALAGLSKTAAREWPEVTVRALDVAPTLAADQAAAQLVDELFHAAPVEVGLDGEGRHTVTLTALSSSPAPRGEPPLTPGDLVVVSGGARGVTADAALALAAAWQPTLLLLGRTPFSGRDAEPEALRSLTDEFALKRALAADPSLTGRPSSDSALTPRELESACRRILADREIRATLERLGSLGVTAAYASVDVRDAAAVARIVSQARERYGPVRGLIHGAGVLADRLIQDKTPQQLAEVWDTKVEGLASLLAALDPERSDLRVLALFSSSTARFGRMGQADYAMANEALNKLARREARLRPECRVVSINWGPWDGGMVTPALRDVFRSEGIEVLDRQAGGRALVSQLALPPSGPVEVVIAGGRLEGEIDPQADRRNEDPAEVSPSQEIEAPERRSGPPAAPRPSPLAEAFTQAVDLKGFPVLRSHVIDLKPVVPMAVVAEWLAQGAMHGNPGLRFQGFHDLTILKGLVLRDDLPHRVRVGAGRAEAHEHGFRVATELRSDVRGDRDTLHAAAEVVLTTALPLNTPPRLARPEGAVVWTPGEIYRERLFHGPDLQAIEQVEGCGPDGIVVVCRSAPAPREWIVSPLRNRWLIDPLVLDGAFQAVILWCIEHRDQAALPSRIHAYRQFVRAFPTGTVQVVCRITRSTTHVVNADVDLVDTGNQALLARLEGFECTLSPSLRAAFRRNRLPSEALPS